MGTILGRFSPYIYAIMRIVMGFLFLWHGSQKLLNYPPSEQAMPLNAITGIAGTIELVGGIMIMIGLFAGTAAFIASGLMAFAYFMAHFSMQKFLPITNHGEPAVVYCFIFLYIAAHGSGIFSVDSLFSKKNGREYQNYANR